MAAKYDDSQLQRARQMVETYRALVAQTKDKRVKASRQWSLDNWTAILEQMERENRNETHEAWDARAVELAYAHHADGTARWLEDDDLFIVPSQSRHTPYTVRGRADGSLVCSCKAGANGRPCKHAGAARLALAKRAAAIAEATRHEATWYGEWLSVEYPAF